MPKNYKNISSNLTEFQYCPGASKLAKEIAKEFTDKAIAIRLKLKYYLRVLQFLLKTSAARDNVVRSLLKGKNL